MDINEQQGAEGGNTYCGKIAHEIMFAAQKIHREVKDSDYQSVVREVCEKVKEGTLKLID